MINHDIKMIYYDLFDRQHITILHNIDLCFEYVTRRDLIMRKIGRLKATNSCENCKELVNSLFKRI